MIKDHKDKIALVTGSSRGLGKYLSIELAKKGFEIILVALPIMPALLLIRSLGASKLREVDDARPKGREVIRPPKPLPPPL